MELNEILKKMRIEKKMSIRELSKLSGVNASYISRLERGIDENPGIDILIKLANALNIKLSEIYTPNKKEELNDFIKDVSKLLSNENVIFDQKLIESISTEESKRFSEELQNKVDETKNYVERTENLLEYLGFEVKITKNSNFNPNSFLNINNVYLAYKNISCNLDDTEYGELINDIYKSIRGTAFNYIIKDK